ncbi:thiol:disulfide interchange protein DsbA/DsbL [Rhizobacter sp. Root1221]|uniref:thiol:disulfide interchange protein DsbA/DsbL n=1 Tax=Rhizobacter sp. Root1221 TaxID=1736433 RepID=UPI0006F223DE|nr:thiol:disulfide interchange protein DsbA/DsbL [Rhizobacter sp. Root1221]KQV95003.1 disulfide bond formation protein DsbA [Rhizobacter sp. Root1221]
MKRRDFSARLAGLGLGASTLATPLLAQAQAKALSESDYVRLSQPLSVEKGKVEVVEFFWYGCPHCFAFEPALDAWQKKLPADVAFRRVPVAFRESYTIHQRLFYAIEAMGKVEELHRKVFQAIHGERKRFEKEDEILEFVGKNGVDTAKFKELLSSFTVSTKAKQASRLAEAYKIDGVPALGIGGKYYTSGQQAGSPDRSLVVADALIDRVRKGG